MTHHWHGASLNFATLDPKDDHSARCIGQDYYGVGTLKGAYDKDSLFGPAIRIPMLFAIASLKLPLLPTARPTVAAAGLGHP